jgi:hypothetical protein
MDTTLAGLAQSPALYPMALDLARGAFLFVRMDEADYRASSFLDERAVTRGEPEQWLPHEEVEHALASATTTRPLHFIFHMGHVGSTLLSRLLDEAGNVLPLREPLPLRAIAEGYDVGAPAIDRHLETMLRLWERGFAETHCIILKATSATERLGPKLLTMRPQARAVLLNVTAESYLATIFAAPNSAADLNAHGPERMHRLGQMGLTIPHPTTLGELAAMSWLVERLTQTHIEREFGGRVVSIDFDAMLQSLEQTVGGVLHHFQISHTPEQVAAIARSSALSRYSKAPERDYSPALRTELLAEARARYPDEIRAALGWMNALATRQPDIAALL